MAELWRQMSESLGDPPRFHALMVHLPIAIGALGLLLLVALAVTLAKSGTFRWSAVALYALGAALAFWTAQSGEDADAHLSRVGVEMTAEAGEELEKHEEMGEAVVWFYVGTALVTAATAVKKRPVRLVALLLALAAGVAAYGWIAATAHHGGSLVYVHGLGVPATPNNFPAPEETEQVEPETPPSPTTSTAPATQVAP